MECSNCINTSANPSTPIGENGLCSVCDSFKRHFVPEQKAQDLKFLETFKGAGKIDCMIGMSGGKDSSATAFKMKELGFNPLGFTFDIGYYPPHIFKRAAKIADRLSIPHQIIDIRRHISEESAASYLMTANFYEAEMVDFVESYRFGREHYSVKDKTMMPYVRTCILCRKTVIPAYYAEAISRGINLVVLGINEWAGLSQNSMFSGVRKLQPLGKPPVYVAHLPFILSTTKSELCQTLEQIGWTAPAGENLIESSSNSCLFAAAAQEKARQKLGFHPDSTRLAREVAVGFITKDEAKAALSKKSRVTMSVYEVLERAKII